MGSTKYHGADMLSPESVAAVQPELLSGESLLWAAQPNPKVIFHPEDWLMVPFSLMWGGFAIFWELAASGGLWHGVSDKSHHANGFFYLFPLWGIPFVIIGQYMIWGRFIYQRWLKKRTYYAVTDRRVITVQAGFSRKVAAAPIDTLPTVVKRTRSDGIGSLRFAELQRNTRGTVGSYDGVSLGAFPAFIDVDDADAVYRLINEQREKARGGSIAAFGSKGS